MIYDSADIALERLLDASGSISSSELAAAAGISRQAAHRLLNKERDRGRLRIEGRARATRYVRAALSWTWPRAGLEEHVAWAKVSATPPFAALSESARQVAQYAFTEMVNNAIDHSGGSRVLVELSGGHGAPAFAVDDDGVGAFAHARELAGLPDELAAVQEISKGRFTTDPARHTGEGLFFTSKAVARFELHSGNLVWIVDNVQGEVALLEGPPRKGTRVVCVVHDPPAIELRDLFDEYTVDLAFVRTRTVVKLFEYGKEFVSRSEAKRLLTGLERFREVVVDFTGVAGIGQGFADEVFRVWPAAHPTTRVLPENMSPVVEFMVRRATAR